MTSKIKLGYLLGGSSHPELFQDVGEPLSLFIPIKPVPASRPRISRYGNYYPESYTDFRKEIYRFFKGLDKQEACGKSKYRVSLEIICKKPKTPSNEYPRGDIDNFVKSYLDSITYAQLAWVDDIQVISINAMKRYQEDGEEYGARLSIQRIESVRSDKNGSPRVFKRRVQDI